MRTPEEGKGKNPLIVLRIIHLSFIISVFIYLLLLYFIGALDFRATRIGITDIIIASLSLPMVLLGFSVPNLLRKGKNDASSLLTAHILRLTLLEGPAILGFILAYMKASYIIWGSLFLASLAFLLLTFPAGDYFEPNKY